MKRSQQVICSGCEERVACDLARKQQLRDSAPALRVALIRLLAETLEMNAELRRIGRGRPEDGAHPDCPIEIARDALFGLE